MKKLNTKTGFTLAELLIVVAIIAILVAIGIPAFSTAMERSRETVDLANIRGAYAEFMADALSGAANTGYYPITLKQKDFSGGTDGWVTDTSGFIGNINGTAMPTPKAGVTYVKFTFKDVTGEAPVCTLETSAPSGQTAKANGTYVYNDT